jgi:NADPH-dependent glutamate synthase beta subunit-like oxidoreductase
MKRTVSQAELDTTSTNIETNSSAMAPGADDEGYMDHDALVVAGASADVTIVGAGPSGLMLA